MRITTVSFILAAVLSSSASAQSTDTGRAAFRAIYEELVEIDSSPTTGSCTKVVNAAEARLRAAGFSADEMHVVIPEGKPDDGNLVARIRASNPTKKGVLLLAHIDVVDAKRADWERDPFTLIEENGFFYGRGSADDKSMAAIFLDLMIRLKQERAFRPKRDLIMALTCGEETSNRVNGVDYLLQNKRELIDAAFAINEGAGGLLSKEGKPLVLQIQAGEKIHQVYTLEVTNPGGHSSRPEPENAIYRLAAATQKIGPLSFPIEVTPVVREYFRITGPLLGGDVGAAMSAVAKNPQDATALASLRNDPSYNALLHTTCVATQLEAGHAPNALPQRAVATLSSSARMYGSGGHRSFEVIGSDGTFVVYPETSKMRVAMRKPQGPYKAGWQQIDLPPQPRYVGDFQELARALKSGKPLKHSYEHELTLHETLLRASGEL